MKWARLIWLWVLLWSAVLLAKSLAMNAISDDTFITLRYARNLLHGEGLVYNPGEWVEGYTSLLWTLAVATLGGLGMDLVVAARGLALVCAVLLIPAAMLAMRPRTASAWLVPPIIAFASPIQCWARAGLETGGYALALVTSLGLAERARDPIAARSLSVALVVLALIRPEGALLAICIGTATAAIQKRTMPATVAIGTVVVHVAWRWHTYGDVVPNTARVKIEPGWDQIAMGLVYVRAFVGKCGGWPIGFLFLAPLVPATLDRGPWRWSLAGFVAVMAITIAEGGDILFMYRFFVPAIPLWALLWAHAADALQTRSRRIGLFAMAVLEIPILWGLDRTPIEDRQVEIMVEQRDGAVPAWTLVGRTMRTWGGSVALVPIGAVGYYSGLVVYDMMGLTDRHIARVAPDGSSRWGHDRHDGAYIVSLEPTYILVGNVRVTEERPDFASDPWSFLSAGASDRRREGDLYQAPDLFKKYVPAQTRLADGRWFSFLVRQDAAHQRR